MAELEADETICPYCRETIKQFATRCKHCHVDLSTQPSLAISPEKRAQDSPLLRCEKCKSSNVQRLSVVHASGTSSTVGIGIAAGGNAGGIGVLAGIGRSKAQTALAQQSSPPTQRLPTLEAALYVTVPLAVILGFLVAWDMGFDWGTYFVSLVAVGLPIFAIVALIIFVLQLLRKEPALVNSFVGAADEERTQYENSFLCLTCGNKFVQHR